jgi:seryl-tRNA synthetase
MLDIKLLREELDHVKAALERRGADYGLEGVLETDAARRAATHEFEQLRAAQNKASKDIAQLKREKQDASEAIAAMQTLSEEIRALDEKRRELEVTLRAQLLAIPNVLDVTVPDGGEEDARVEREWGERPNFDFSPKDHVELGESLGLLDFERAAKITGARFCLSRGMGARLERALINFMLDMHTTEHGYTEVLPPFIVNSDSLTGTGQLPKFAEDLFHLEGTDYWLIPTAEVPVTNIFRDEILDEAQLPIHYTAYTPCFRSEAGSHGKDTRGMIRQHQFNKVELVKFCEPEDSWDELEALVQNAQAILQRLGLHHRVVTLAARDTGFSAAKTCDIEVWLPSQDRYREISSCSNFLDFQARRANIRFRRAGGEKPEFVHTLNGSGLAVGRTVIAILDQFQRADGSVEVPAALRPYLGGTQVITATP